MRGGGLLPANPTLITAEMTVDAIVARFPAAAAVFVRRRMHCVGCMVARFESLAEVCHIYDQPIEAVLGDLRRAAALPQARSDSHLRQADGERSGME